MKKILTYQTKIKVFDCSHSSIALVRSRQWLVASLTILLLMMGKSMHAQTTLAAGDVAVIAVNSANPDMISIVLLKPIATNTVINFTDNGFTSATAGRTGEGFLTYTAPSNQGIGTVLTWTNGMTIAGTGWSSNNPTNFALNGGGDQLFLFQGSTANWATQSGITLLYGLNFGTALSSTSAAANTLQPSTTILPSTSFLNLPSTTNANGYFANGTSSATSTTVSGTIASLLALFVNATKWFGNSASVATFPTYSITTITGATTTTAFTTTYGTASAAQTFTVGGTALTANLVATAPAGFQVSSDGTTYGTTATFTQTSGTASGSLRIRLAATAAVTGTYNSRNIVLSSTGLTSANIATPASGNSVAAKALTITGVTANNKVYDGTTAATLTGTAVLNGVVNSDVVNLGGTGTATFATNAVGTGKTVSVSGYTISGAGAGNYTLTQPTGLTANITCNTPSITLGSNPSVCSGETSANLTYSATAGSPDQYSVTYDAAALTAGFVSTTNTTLASSPIVLTVPAAAAAATYNATLTVRHSASGCVSTIANITITVNPRPTVAISNKVNDACMLGVGAVTITGSGGTAPLSITWTAMANASRPVGATGSATGSPAGTAQTSPVTYTDLRGWYDYNFLVTDSNGCTAPSIGNQ